VGYDHHTFLVLAESANFFCGVFIGMNDRIHTITFLHFHQVGRRDFEHSIKYGGKRSKLIVLPDQAIEKTFQKNVYPRAPESVTPACFSTDNSSGVDFTDSSNRATILVTCWIYFQNHCVPKNNQDIQNRQHGSGYRFADGLPGLASTLFCRPGKVGIGIGSEKAGKKLHRIT